MGWTSVEICRVCWVKMKGPVEPTRFIADSGPDDEPCALCGQPASDGIFVRLFLEKK